MKSFRLYLCLALSVCFVRQVDAQSGKLEPLVVSYAGITGGRGPLWVAKELGYFEKYGLDAKLVHIAAGATSINALIAGDVDMVLTT